MVHASAANSATLLSASATSPPSSSPSRPGRLRRLTYLRSHTQSDFRPQTADSTPTRPNRPLLFRSGSSEATASQAQLRASASPPVDHNTQATPRAKTQSRQTVHPDATPHVEQGSSMPTITRRRSSTIPGAANAVSGLSQVNATHPTEAASSTQPAPSRAIPGTTKQAQAQLPAIRFVPYQDSRSSRPSLSFPTISRILPEQNSLVRVGRYSEKDAPPEVTGEAPSDAAVGFKSKVVSRRHCEFFYKDARWWIRDVKSSSGTFLNHIRLSPAGQESRPYRIKDGDIVQLGIDFKGGEESIFRCVKIRILCNRGWQAGLNSFNTSAHKQLQQLTKNGARSTDSASGDSTDCTICLSPIGPCQSLFIAPCSHTWHYKCIRPIIMQHGEFRYPDFLCPNCRAVTDLEEDIDDVAWDQADEAEELDISARSAKHDHDPDTAQHTEEDDDLAVEMANATLQEILPHPPAQPRASEAPIFHRHPSTSTDTSNGLNPDASSFVPASTPAITIPFSSRKPNLAHSRAELGSPEEPPLLALTTMRTMTPGSTPFTVAPDADGPMTPRNDAGPFVFDGTAGDVEGEGRGMLGSLDGTARV